MTTPSVRIDYLYVDGANYKRRASWNVPGVADEAALLATLTSDGFFVPDAVGMPMLCPGGGEWDDSIDHAFHSIDAVVQADAMVDEDRTFDELLLAFSRADWERAGADVVAAVSP